LKNLFYLVLFVCIVIIIPGCSRDESIVQPADNKITGEADFSSFVVIGNSITSGYQSNSLFKSAQENSFGNLIAGQVKTNFVQPLISDPGTGNRIELISVDPFRPQVNLNKGAALLPDYSSSYNNLGVPGAYTYDVVNAYNKETSFSSVNGGSGNDMFDLILRNKGTQFQQAKSLNPSFLILWIGNNDILGYVLSGGTAAFTPPALFENYYRQMADSIASLKAKVITGNIPDVSIIPYLTVVNEQLKKEGVDSVWAISSGDTLLLDLNKNYITLMAYIEEIYDFSGHLTGRGLSKEKPIRDKYILDENEAKTAAEIVDKFNSIIANISAEKGFLPADFYTLFKNIKSSESSGGFSEGGEVFTSRYYYGNLFSLDGVHPSNKGHALIADTIIKLVNNTFKSSIPLINIGSISNNF
jgi:lysophospholipase L1-like esterase